MFCKQCGTKLEENSKICPACGTDNERKEENISNTQAVEVVNPETPKGDGKATASMVFGIISLFLWPLSIIGLIVSLIGLILGATFKGKSGKKTAGIVTNVIGMVLSILMTVFVVGVVMGVINKTRDIVEEQGLGNFGDLQEYIEQSNIPSMMNVISDWSKYYDLKKISYRWRISYLS